MVHGFTQQSRGTCAFPADSASTHHLSSGNVQQVGLVVAGRQGLRLQSAGILQLLYGGELRLAVAGVSHAEAWRVEIRERRLLITADTPDNCNSRSSTQTSLKMSALLTLLLHKKNVGRRSIICWINNPQTHNFSRQNFLSAKFAFCTAPQR